MSDAKSADKGLPFILTIATLGVVRFFSVPQGHVRVVTAFGKYVRTAQPGLDRCLSFWGLYQRPEFLIPTRENVRDYPEEQVYTRDGIEAVIDMVVFFTVKEPVKAVFEVDDYERAIWQLIQAILRNECGQLAARELLAGRQKLAKNMRETLDRDTDPWGISVRLVEIKGITMKGQNAKGAAS